jgi:hypothetical protein
VLEDVNELVRSGEPGDDDETEHFILGNIRSLVSRTIQMIILIISTGLYLPEL